MANGKLRQLERKNKIPKLCDYHRENKLNVDEEYKIIKSFQVTGG